MLVRDGTYYQRRWQTDFNGWETNVEPGLCTQRAFRTPAALG
jgi:hypothetical protein